MDDAFANLRETIRFLTSDVEQAETLHQSTNGTDFSRRVLVKTLFTYLEGHLFAFKQAILALEHALAPMILPNPNARSSMLIRFTDAERAVLREINYELTSGSEAREATYYLRFPENTKFAFNLFQRALELDDKVDYSTTGWAKFKEAQRIRNRITHPKSAAALQITVDELETVRAGADWYDHTVNQLLDRVETESPFARMFRITNNQPVHHENPPIRPR